MSPSNAAKVQTGVGLLTPTAVVSAAESVAEYLRKERWVGTNNVFRTKTVNRIRERLDKSSWTPRDDKHISEYVASAALLHCSDGWSYLGRALTALAFGDQSSTRHLAYYAELRASMSLLATTGIGIFSNQHCVLQTSGTYFIRGVPTHVVAWLALEEWANIADSANLLGEAIRPAGRDISDWVQAMPAGGSWAPLGSSWLRAWGLDLKQFTQDQNERNEVSYRPTRIQSPPPLDAEASVNLVRDIWSLLEPGPVTVFENIDRHLLRLTLEEVFKATTGRSHRAASRRYRNALDKTLQQAAGSTIDSALGKFLLRVEEPADSPLVSASLDPGASPLTGVMSRATLLLRAATGACQALCRKADIEGDDLRFWAEQVGNDLGLWGDEGAPASMSALWADVELAFEGLADLLDSGPVTTRAIKESAGLIASLGGTERVPLWALSS